MRLGASNWSDRWSCGIRYSGVLVLASVGPAVPEIWTLAWIGKKFWNLAQLRNDLFRSVSLDSHLLILLD